MRSCHSVCTGIVGSFPGQGMRRIHNDSTRDSSERASGCGRDSRDLDRTLADEPGVQRTIVQRTTVRNGVTCIPPRREVYRVNQVRMARNSGFLGKIISTIFIAVPTVSSGASPNPLNSEYCSAGPCHRDRADVLRQSAVILPNKFPRKGRSPDRL